jgi:hypothetical protein
MASPVLPAFVFCFSGAALISADLFKINPIQGEFNIFLQFYGLSLNRDHGLKIRNGAGEARGCLALVRCTRQNATKLAPA